MYIMMSPAAIPPNSGIHQTDDSNKFSTPVMHIPAPMIKIPMPICLV